MPSMQIVFLFDLNAYIEDKLKIGPDLNSKLLCLRLTCLKILTHYCTIEPNLKWGFKFFDSRGSLTQRMCKFSFPNVSLDSFETLENEITLQYQRHHSYLEALNISAHRQDSSEVDDILTQTERDTKTFYPVQVLQLALTQILCEYQWSNQMTLFSPSKNNHIYHHMNKHDLLFLITKCPKNETQFSEYFGTEYESVTSAKFSKVLLSRSLHEQLLIKSSILWIWLNTSSDNFLGEMTAGMLTKMSEMLKFLKCILIPLSILSFPPHTLKLKEGQDELQKVDLFNSLLPFSTIFAQSITYPFYLDKDTVSRYSILCFQKKELFVSIIKIQTQQNRDGLLPERSREMCTPDESCFSSKKCTEDSLIWSKFVVHFALPKRPCQPAIDVILCLPSISSKDSNFKQFQLFNANLISKNISLFLTCESTCGIASPGLLTPLSDTSALIFVLKSEIFLKNNVSTERILEIYPSDLTETVGDKIQTNAEIQNDGLYLKPFQVESLEHWYNPSNAIGSIAISNNNDEKNSKDLMAFYKKISSQLSADKQISSPEKENIAPNEDIKNAIVSKEIETFDASGLSYDKLITSMTATYESALKSEKSLLHSARKIVKTAYSFFQQNPSNSNTLEDLLKSFMSEFFYASNKKINDKYEESENNEQRIVEYRLQILFIFEVEIISPSPDRSSCVQNIISLLRSMSFYSGAIELNKFLQDTLKENYKDTLYETLLEIGDELDIPLFEEEDSPYEASEPPSSEPMMGSNNSIFSNALSSKSSSNSSNRTGNKKIIKRRSDIMDNSKNPQFLLTRSSPKKRKYKNLCPGAENIPTRYSPRLSSKRKRERNKKYASPGHVRRNLFSKDYKLLTPKYSPSPRSKRRTQTPKAHHVLKTNFVAETPTSKQNRSAIQRRKSFMDTDDSETSLTEIAESPKIKKNAKDNTHKEVLKRLSSLESKTFAQPVQQPMPTYSQYTPESKRRLSLKLFSKLLTSPTARMGLKKCSKRLFDQVSPQVDKTLHKKPRIDVEASENIGCSSQQNSDSDSKDQDQK